MGSKTFCDACGVEIKYPYGRCTYSDFSSLLEGRHLEFCKTCSAKMRNFICNLEQEQKHMQKMMKQITETKRQMVMDGFLGYY